MPYFKIIATVSWEFEAEGSIDSINDRARKLIDEVVDHNPQGEDFQGYGIQMELVPLKDRNSPVKKLREFTPSQIFAWIDEGNEKKTFQIGKETYEVKMTSDRYQLFRNSPVCVACGIIGKKFLLECQPGEPVAHFNMYAEEDGRNVLMTKDHIRAKAYGGTDTMSNYATCCSTCNQLKASYPISYESVKVLRDMLRNKDRLPTKELRRRIADTRLLMMDCLNGQ